MDKLPCKDHGKQPCGKRGYAQLRRGGRNLLAHRLAWAEANGVAIDDIPQGMFVMHKCDNPRCVEPTHLELGTHQDNMDDMVRKGRSLRGEAAGRAVLSDEVVREIKDTYIPRHREYGGAAFARKYGVHQTTISLIVTGKNRKGDHIG